MLVLAIAAIFVTTTITGAIAESNRCSTAADYHYEHAAYATGSNDTDASWHAAKAEAYNRTSAFAECPEWEDFKEPPHD